ncbi:hypothetical protein H0194_03080 [Corynebacterium incognita]|uniref:D-isomer specific 2-hydroxyacid dehydrogenase NAD-binding domain-containing protein n=1 Tax=Corynebacterium incognita TaxID=2754725 RepID=A0A7G7CR03_9CORY|nr:D-isomer specific 2-hydroxyacid dehydrogenase family protein [Corynebacterium incognita]QNE90019.1 hypothetical protein H0194_03080 [Corynebacterium incognita]
MKYFMGPFEWEETIADITELAERHKDSGLELERVDALEDAEAFVYTGGNAENFPAELPSSVKWVQHCFTGVEALIEAGVMPGYAASDSAGTAPADATHTPAPSDAPAVRWANTAGAFAQPVAEMALGFILSQGHRHVEIARTRKFSERWEQDAKQFWLYQNRRILILGAGGIGQELMRMLDPFGAEVVAVNRSGRPVPGALETVTIDEAMDFSSADARGRQLWSEADVVVNVLPITPETEKLIGAEQFAAMPETSLFVNVGRGRTVDTDALVEALRSGAIAGAGLEVMDPEPLPDDHPLWDLDNCTMTPHIGASHRVARFHVGQVFVDNAVAYLRGETMPTEIAPGEGY